MLIKRIASIIFISIVLWLIYSVFSANQFIVAQKINVQLLWDKNKLDCQSVITSENNDEMWFIKQFQFFLSDIEITSEGTDWQRLKLIKNPYQSLNTVLLGADCREGKGQESSETLGHWSIDFDNNIDISKVNSLRFTLGVPFESNHLNPITQESPLNLPSMFWVWQNGHKFMRAELSSQNDQWLFHLGSTGCKAASAMRAPKSACRYPNTFNVEIPINKNNSNQLTLNLNLARLLNNVELTQTSSCQSERDASSCQQLFNNLSLEEKSTNKKRDEYVFNATNVSNISEGLEVE